jgi:hypothetical protein
MLGFDQIPRRRDRTQEYNVLIICLNRSVRGRDVVGMRSRASGVARPEAVAAFAYSRLFVRLFTIYGRATPDARERIPTTQRPRERIRRGEGPTF